MEKERSSRSLFWKSCRLRKAEGTISSKSVVFSADRLIVDLDKDTADGQRIQHVSMQDQQVLFESIHLLEGKRSIISVLPVASLIIRRPRNRLTALGLGKLELNNQQVPAVLQTSDPISLQKPCFAYMDLTSWCGIWIPGPYWQRGKRDLSELLAFEQGFLEIR